MGRSNRWVIAVACSLFAAAACGDDDGYPEGLHDPCETDADCRDEFQCLEWPNADPPEMVCSQTCETKSDCPRVTSEQCGDQTLCREGVCGFYYCR